MALHRNNKGSSFKTALLSVLVIQFTACSFIERNTIGLFGASENSQVTVAGEVAPLPAPQVTAPQPVEIKALQQPPQKSLEDIDVIWKIPQEAVDGFVIHYGNAPEKLPSEVKLSIPELERFDHPQFGPVYRYVLKGFNKNDKIFVSVSAFTDTLVSPPSSVLEAKVTDVESKEPAAAGQKRQ